MKLIDDFLNKITMYRLLLYYLICLLCVAAGLSLFGILSFNLFQLLFSTLFLLTICWATNTIFAKTFNVPTNLESVYITSLILILIITPANTLDDYIFLFWAGVLSMSSKYILNLKNKHLFNPAAFAIALTALTINRSASWWVGTEWMMWPVLIGGLLIVRKIKRFSLIISFLTVASLISFILFFMGHNLNEFGNWLQRLFGDTPILFLAFVMLTEPLTSPPTKTLQMVYGGLVGFLFSPQLHFGPVSFTPEQGLLIGNIFAYIVSPKIRSVLKLRERIQLSPDIFDYVFDFDKKFNFIPGQYMEWTLGHENPDSRGSRRYFTLASSPSEDNLRLGVKFYQNGSSFKKSLSTMSTGGEVIASQISGEFTLPKDVNRKLVFIAGGIGITPFRSILKYLIDTNQKRDIILFFSNKLASEIVYKDVFDEALKKFNTKTIYVLSDVAQVPANWPGKVGTIDVHMIQQEVPDFKERTFYISGPHGMVQSFEDNLSKLGLPKSQIKVDFFPGYA